MDCTTCSIPPQSVCCAQRWTNKLSTKMGIRPQVTPVWNWWDGTIPTSNNQSLTNSWAKVLQWHLAWKRYNDEWVHHWDLRKDHQGKNNQKTSIPWKIQQATGGRDQCIPLDKPDTTNNTTSNASTCKPKGSKPCNWTDSGWTTSNEHADSSATATTVAEPSNGFTTSGAHTTEHSCNITNGNITANGSTTSTANAITTATSESITNKENTRWGDRRSRIETRKDKAKEGAQEPKATRLRTDAVTITTKKGEKITTASNEDSEEMENEKMLLEPQVWDTEGLDKEQTKQGMKKEAESMKRQGFSKELASMMFHNNTGTTS